MNVVKRKAACAARKIPDDFDDVKDAFIAISIQGTAKQQWYMINNVNTLFRNMLVVFIL